MSFVYLLAISLIFTGGAQKAHKQSDEIGEDDLRHYLAKQNDCENNQIYFSMLEHVDFLKKGYKQAVVVASTCMTGTAGPDIHAVYTRDAEGEIKELPMQEVKLPHTVLFGNSNSTFRIGEGVLVEVYSDTSERDDPLIVKYRWNAEKEIFEIIAIEAATRYPTSYDCDKAEKSGDETALAICYVEQLADLDIDLANLYKSYLARLSEAERKSAIAEQRAWLQERNKSCGIYKWWVDCLDASYKKRIAELQSKLEQKKKEPVPQTHP
jgi:uncharacterized protein YecT (DUF1311 family)